jgi:predicted RNase H-like HicB family nuclease
MRYPILIEPGTDGTAFGVVVPDLPGCFSAGDTLEQALEATGEAATAWIDAALDSGEAVPPPSGLEAIGRLRDFSGWAIGFIDLDAGLFRDAIKRRRGD